MQTEYFATCWTIAGEAGPAWPDPRSPIPFLDRVQASAAAGFTGLGVIHQDLVVAVDEHGFAGVRAILADHGITTFETEALVDWAASGPRREASDQVRRFMLTAAEELAPRHLKILPDDSGEPWQWEQWAADFAELARQCGDVGTRVAIEFLPWTNIATVEDATRLLDLADRPEAGLILDIWHTERSETAPQRLAELPAERILGVELSDAVAQQGTMREDTMNRRRYCGEGDFDVAGFIQAIAATGFTGPWGVEILSEHHRVLPLTEAARRAHDSTAAAVTSALGR